MYKLALAGDMFLFASARRSGDVDGLEKNKSWPISVSGARFLTYFLNFLSVKYSDSSRARVELESSRVLTMPTAYACVTCCVHSIIETKLKPYISNSNSSASSSRELICGRSFAPVYSSATGPVALPVVPSRRVGGLDSCLDRDRGLQQHLYFLALFSNFIDVKWEEESSWV